MKRGASLSLACLLSLLPARSRAGGETRFSAWIVPWDAADVSDGCFAELNPFAFALSPASALISASPDLLKEVSRRRRAGVALVPVVVNDVYAGGKAAELKSSRALAVLLSNPGNAARHVEELNAAAEDFAGLEIDYESVPPALWSAYVDFVEKLAAALHRGGRRLAIDVEPRMLARKDWARLVRAADRIKLMAYYERGGTAPRPGAGSSQSWVVDVAGRALRVVPAEKLVVALSLAGTEWAPAAPRVPVWTAKRLNYGQVMELRSKSGSEVVRDASSAPSFRVVRDGGEHEVWFEDEQSLGEKIRVLHSIGIKRIAFWYWGRRHPDAGALGLCRP